MKPKRILLCLMALLMVVGMVLPSVAATATQTTFTATTQTPSSIVSTDKTDEPGVWKFVYPVVLWKMTWTLTVEEATGQFEGLYNGTDWRLICRAAASGLFETTSTYSYTAIRYTGDPAEVANVKFEGQYLRGVTGDLIVPTNVEVYRKSYNEHNWPTTRPWENGWDFDRNTSFAHTGSNNFSKEFMEQYGLSKYDDPVYITYELPEVTRLTEIVLWHTLTMGDAHLQQIQIQTSLDGVNWDKTTDGVSYINNVLLASTVRNVTMPKADWTTYSATIKSDPYYSSDNSKDNLDTVTVKYQYYSRRDYSGFIFNSDSLLPAKYIRVYYPKSWTMTYADLSFYGVAINEATPSSPAYTAPCVVPQEPQELVPVTASQPIWKLADDAQITGISWTSTGALTGGKWYGAGEKADKWYDLATITATENAGSDVVNTAQAVRYVKFVGDTTLLNLDSVTFTGRTQILTEPNLTIKDYVYSGFASTVTKDDVAKFFDGDVTTGNQLAVDTTDTTYSISIGVKLEQPSIITEFVVYQDLENAACIDANTVFETSMDGIHWTKWPVNGQTGPILTTPKSGDTTLINANTTNQGYVYHINVNTATASVAVQYVRLSRTGNSGNFSIKDFQLYGRASHEYALASDKTNLGQSGGRLEGPIAPASISANLLVKNVVTFSGFSGNKMFFTEIALAAGPDLKVEGSNDGETWGNLGGHFQLAGKNSDVFLVSGSDAYSQIRLTSLIGIDPESVTLTGYNADITGTELGTDLASVTTTSGWDGTHLPGRTWMGSTTSVSVASASSASAAGVYTGIMLATPSVITEVMLWPHTNFANRMDLVRIQAATADDPNTWVTLAIIDLTDESNENAYDATIYGEKGPTDDAYYGKGTKTGVKYTITDDTEYAYVRLFKSVGVNSDMPDQVAADGLLCVAACEIYGTPANGNPANGDNTNFVWFIVAPICLVAVGATAGLLIVKKKKQSRV